MSTTSKSIVDNSNSPYLFCYEPSPQIIESENSNIGLSTQNSKKSSQKPHESVRNYPENESTPGPGAYTPQNAMRAIYKSSPAYTMRAKNDNRNYSYYNSTPGPGAHHDSRTPRIPNGMFANRHSWYKAPFITQYK